MVRIEEYKSEVVSFYCDKCDFHGEYDINPMLSDNCVVDVDVICELCGECVTLYVLKCKDEIEADLLNAKFKSLKSRKAMEV